MNYGISYCTGKGAEVIYRPNSWPGESLNTRGFGPPRSPRYVHSGWVIERCVYVMEEWIHGVRDTHARDGDGEVYLTCLGKQGCEWPTRMME